MKKLLSILLGCIVITGLLAACSDGASGSLPETAPEPVVSAGEPVGAGEDGTDEMPAELLAIQDQMVIDLVDNGQTYAPAGAVYESDTVIHYRGTLTQIIPGPDNGGYIVVEQTAGGVDYGTPVFAGWSSLAAIGGTFQVGDYVEISYNLKSVDLAEIYHGSKFPAQILTLLCSKERMDADEVVHAVATIVSTDSSAFEVQLEDGSTMRFEVSDSPSIFENTAAITDFAAGDKVEFWGGFYNNYDKDEFQVEKFVKI